MNAEPISKELYNKLIAEGINDVKLSFSGGNDEGYLDQCEDKVIIVDMYTDLYDENNEE